MNNLYKICFISAIFLASASLAWAGLNYDSARNYYVLDAALKFDGSYILVGSSLNSHANSLVAGNNIILPNRSSKFTSSDNPSSREFGLEANETYLKTKAITLNNTADLKIFSSDSPLVIKSASGDTVNLFLNKDFIFLKNLLVGQGSITSNDSHIYAPEIAAQELKLLTASALAITSGNIIRINNIEGRTASADNILVGDSDKFCQVIDYSEAVERSRQNARADSKSSRDTSVADLGCADNGADTTEIENSATRTCCPAGYHVFDIWEGGQWDNATLEYVGQGKMVCCRYAESKLIMTY